MKIVLCGLTRDSGRKIKDSVLSLLEAIEPYGTCSAFIVESDSKDDTPARLLQLSEENATVSVLLLGELESQFPNRLERLAFCRNEYLRHVRASNEFDFMVVADLDGINSKVSKTTFEGVFDNEYAAQFANQEGPYYDILALRHPDWCNSDVLKQKEFFTRLGKTDFEAGYRAIVSKMIRIPKLTQPIPVSSAFGGLGVYNLKKIPANASYGYIDKGGAECSEHVKFNQQIHDDGFQLVIQPSMINAKFTEHTSGLRLSRRLIRSISLPFRTHF